MSAYQCNACHLTVLALYAVRHGLVTGPRAKPAGVVEILSAENLRSLDYRYPAQRSNNATTFGGRHGMDRLFTIAPCRPCVRAQALDAGLYTPIEILKAADCYEYQACEHPGWDTSVAKDICDAIRTHALARVRVPGWCACNDCATCRLRPEQIQHTQAWSDACWGIEVRHGTRLTTP